MIQRIVSINVLVKTNIMKNSSGLSLFLMLLFFGAAFFLGLIFRSVPIVSEDECLIKEGIVTKIFEGGTKDVCFRLLGEESVFYINRGLEQGLHLDTLKEQLIGQKVTIKYPEYWTPLDPKKSTIHLSKLEYADYTIFSELSD